tara:strand:+ start:544 stop:843 length:300 start_codon:yes stop_codon:yes gene_type:complete
MKNIQGNKENLKLYNEKGVKVYEFCNRFNGSYLFEYTYDNSGRPLTFKNSDGYWSKWTRDEKGNELTYEDLYGVKRGFDTPEFTMEGLVKKLGNFKLIK